MKKKAYILDYNCGNVKSVRSAFINLGYQIEENKNKPLDIETLLIIPGVGHFGNAMKHINDNGLAEKINSHHQNGGNILGICLGLQLLFSESEEAPGVKGLGLIEGSVKNLKNSSKFYKTKIQKMHLGWSATKFINQDLFHDMYYVHQYYCDPKDPSIINETFDWGENKLCAGINTRSIRGFQFHPEKSGKSGLELLSSL